MVSVPSPVEIALAATVGGGTARFRSRSRQSLPIGTVTSVYEGIADFVARRAIARLDNRPLRSGGLLTRHVEPPGAEIPHYILFDGPRSYSQQFNADGWQEPAADLPDGLPRQPAPLAVLDLIRPESIVQVVQADPETINGEVTRHYEVELDLDQIDWPSRSRIPTPATQGSLVARLATKTLPDPTPKGLVRAEVWGDSAGRLCRFRYGPPGSKAGSKTGSEADWLTTELWDFGGPPSIQDWRHQPVIDPITLQRALPPLQALRQASRGEPK